MYKGKATCKILKEIRKQIAQENDIAFVTSECKYQGDCAGTCPACEAEVRYLEEELRKRKQLGKTAIVAGISFGLAATFAGCHSAQSPQPEQEVPVPAAIEQSEEANSAPVTDNGGSATPSPRAPRPAKRSPKDIIDFGFNGKEEKAPGKPSTMSSDTIEIVAEFPEFERDGTISVTRISDEQPNNIYTYAAQPPTFPGGDSIFRKKIHQKFHISKKMRDELKGHNVKFQVIIRENGKAQKATILHSNIPTAQTSKFDKTRTRKLEHAATRALKSLPSWSPGKDLTGKAVPCYQTMTIEIR